MEHSFDVDIAQRFGILEAILIKNFQFWIAKNRANNKNFHDGAYWTYNSTGAFQQLFPYASRKQIERALKHLRDEGILKTGNYNDSSYDRTLWYSFTEKGETLSQIRAVHFPYLGNGNPEKGEPIPDILPNKDTYILSLFNEICPSLPRIQAQTPGRVAAVKALLSAGFTLEKIREAFEKAEASPFLNGSATTFRANIDWILDLENITRILEGVYDSRPAKKKQSRGAGGSAENQMRQNALATERVNAGAAGLGELELEAMRRLLQGTPPAVQVPTDPDKMARERNAATNHWED